MSEGVTRTGLPWTLQGVQKLRELWNDGVGIELICQTLGRSEAEIRAKAGELKLPQHVDMGG